MKIPELYKFFKVFSKVYFQVFNTATVTRQQPLQDSSRYKTATFTRLAPFEDRNDTKHARKRLFFKCHSHNKQHPLQDSTRYKTATVTEGKKKVATCAVLRGRNKRLTVVVVVVVVVGGPAYMESEFVHCLRQLRYKTTTVTRQQPLQDSNLY